METIYPIVLIVLLIVTFLIVIRLCRGKNVFLFSKVKGRKYLHGVFSLGSHIDVNDGSDDSE